MKLDKSFIAAVSPAIYATWGQIAPDAETEDNDCAIELCVDADRMYTAGYEDADTKVREAIKEHGWQPVARYLSRNIHLV